MNYENHLIEKIKKSAHYLDNKAFDDLLKHIGDAQIVLLGEATHGTHEFYVIRSEITKKLILEKNFNAIVIEGDWPDAYCINDYITHDTFVDAREALTAFNRFPTWMWQNIPMVELIEWLKNYNKKKNMVNFFGLDLYSLYQSIDAIITQLEQIDPP